MCSSNSKGSCAHTNCSFLQRNFDAWESASGRTLARRQEAPEPSTTPAKLPRWMDARSEPRSKMQHAQQDIEAQQFTSYVELLNGHLKPPGCFASGTAQTPVTHALHSHTRHLTGTTCCFLCLCETAVCIPVLVASRFQTLQQYKFSRLCNYSDGNWLFPQRVTSGQKFEYEKKKTISVSSVCVCFVAFKSK